MATRRTTGSVPRKAVRMCQADLKPLQDPKTEPMATADSNVTQVAPSHLSGGELVVAARSEAVQPSRSRLAPCAEVISILREKRWSYAAITAWLAQRGLRVAESTVQRFHRARQRKAPSTGQPRAVSGDQLSAPSSSPTYEAHQIHDPGSSTRSARRPKYNTDF